MRQADRAVHAAGAKRQGRVMGIGYWVLGIVYWVFGSVRPCVELRPIIDQIGQMRWGARLDCHGPAGIGHSRRPLHEGALVGAV